MSTATDGKSIAALRTPRQQIQDFVSVVYEPSDIVEVRMIRNRHVLSKWYKAADLASHTDELLTHNGRRYNIYVGVCPRRTIGGTKNEDVDRARVLVADFDHTDLADALRRWTAVGLPTPSMIVLSGHGVHIYLKLASEIAADVFTGFQQGLIKLLESDPVIHDPARIMRLSGFKNWKEPVADATIYDFDAGLQYAAEDLHEFIPCVVPASKLTPIQANEPDNEIEALAVKHLDSLPAAISGQGGHPATYTAAVALVHGFGLDKPTALRLLTERYNPRCKPPWSPDELRHKVEDAVTKTHKSPRLWLLNKTAAAAIDIGPEFIPFPTDALPFAVRQFVEQTADSMRIDNTFVALPSLAALAAAIGTTRVIELKSNWTEPAVLWTCVVAVSGGTKSPPYEQAIAPIWAAQDAMVDQYNAAAMEYEAKLLDYERERASKKRGEPVPHKPVAPIMDRIVVSDVTIESLSPVLRTSPRGLLGARDELSGWIGSFNQYKNGKGSDVANWLELHRAGRLAVDRKTGEPKTIIVRRAAVSVTGTLQPHILARAMTPELMASGLLARLFVACPPVVAKQWTDREPSRATTENYHKLIARLMQIPPVGPVLAPEPLRLPLTPEAKEVWVEFYNRHGIRTFEASNDNERAAFSKLEGGAARFALIFALCDDYHATLICADAMRRGIKVAEWFAHEAERVYRRMAESPETAEARWLLDWIAHKGGEVSVRDLVRGTRKYKSTEAAERALRRLKAAGLAEEVEIPPGPTGGRPRFVFRLTRADETPELLNNSEVMVTSALSTGGEAA